MNAWSIPKSWLLTTVSAVAHRVTKGMTPTSLGRAYTSEGVLFVKVESLANQRIEHGRCAFIDDATHDELARSQLQDGDVLFSIAGTLGRVAVVRSEDTPSNTNQAVAIIRRSSATEPRFLDPFMGSHKGG
jgi:type I restriction enzyme, S subunit